jgi:hypothetical protein
VAGLKSGVTPLSPEDLADIIKTIKADLNLSFGLNLNVGTEHTEHTAVPASRWRFILVGASHARRTCDLMTSMKMQAATIGSTSWYATKSNCAKLASDLEELLNGLEPEDGISTVVVFNILDKAYFQAKGEDGSYIPHRQ